MKMETEVQAAIAGKVTAIHGQGRPGEPGRNPDRDRRELINSLGYTALNLGGMCSPFLFRLGGCRQASGICIIFAFFY